MLWRESPLEIVGRRILLVMVLVASLAPIILIVLTSFKTRVDALSVPPVWLFKPTLDNYRGIFASHNFGLFFRNSAITGLVATFLSTFIGSFAAYGLARYPFRGSQGVAYWILSLRMAPPIAAIIPLFILLRGFGLIDTLSGLILVYTVMNLPFVIWLMRGFFEDLPQEVEESARVDGCSAVGAFFRVALPLSAPGLTATAILTFLFTWNEFLFALIFTGRKAQTLPVAVTVFLRETGIDWGYMAAAASLMMLPTIVFTCLVQQRVVRGLTLGAIK